MSKITLDNLSDNLKAYLEGLGLTEEQVLNLINENGLDEEELKAMLKDTMSINELNTNSKTVIGAINELFQDVDNGKNLIATSIGNPLITGNSTFNAMSEAILGLRRNTENETDAREVLYNMMLEDGYSSATISMTVDELIELLDDSNIDVGDIKQIACGAYHTMVLKNDGSLWACGQNGMYGQAGLGSTVFTTSFTQVTNDVKQVACGNGHTMVIKNDGSVWACGYNNNGQLGLGNTTNQTTFTQVTTNINHDAKHVACGDYYTMVIKNDGSLWACGVNMWGQLGLGDTNDRTTFTQVTTNINNDVKQLACGQNHMFILKNDGSVWACGFNGSGQLGLGNNGSSTSKNTFTQVTTNINNDVKQVDCGNAHTIILKNDGSVWSSGYNNNGQLGLGDNTDRNKFTQVTTNINNDVKQVVCGGAFTFILKNVGSVWACGVNDRGQLGLGNANNYNAFTQILTNINNDVKQIACDQTHTFILKNDGTVWSCGYNDSGQLGLGNGDNKNTFTKSPAFGSVEINEYEINRQKLYYYLLDNEIQVTENMDINTMLNLLVDDYINNLISGYENNLRIILTDEGVSVNNEDNMDSLIAKVDEEFSDKENEISNLEIELTGKVDPVGTATASDVASGKTFINSTGKVITGTNKKVVINDTATTYDAVHNGSASYPIEIVINHSFGSTPSNVIITLDNINFSFKDTGGTTKTFGNSTGSNSIISNIHTNASKGVRLFADGGASSTTDDQSNYFSTYIYSGDITDTTITLSINTSYFGAGTRTISCRVTSVICY